MVKNLPAMQETWVQSLDREDLLEKGMSTYSSTVTWRIPWTEEPGRLQSMRLQTVGHPLETRPDSPGEPGMQPRDPCLPWRGKLGPGHTLR